MMAATTARTGARSLGNRAFWAGALALIATAGLYSSARAANEREAMSNLGGSGCDPSAVGWGWDVTLAGANGYVVSGVRFTTVPDECIGQNATVAYTDASGAIVAQDVVALAAGVTYPVGTAVTPGVIQGGTWRVLA